MSTLLWDNDINVIGWWFVCLGTPRIGWLISHTKRSNVGWGLLKNDLFNWLNLFYALYASANFLFWLLFSFQYLISASPSCISLVTYFLYCIIHALTVLSSPTTNTIIINWSLFFCLLNFLQSNFSSTLQKRC